MTTAQAPTVANGRFVVEAHLGEGGQAAVFRVRDLRLGVQRALKVLLPKFVSKPKVRHRFADEARTMALLEHPNIVRVYDVDNDGPVPYLVMELVPSGSLADWLDVFRRFPPGQAVEVILQVCAGASAAHAAGVIHRDLKPQNVLVGVDGTCKITDFGIARTGESHRTRVGAALGTEGYMAPEQSRDARAVDARADVYSIGITLFVLLTGTDPVEWLSGRARDKVPAALRTALERATALRTADRYATAAEFAAGLEQAREALPPDPVRLPLNAGRPSRGGVVTSVSPASDDWYELGPLLDHRAPSEPPTRARPKPGPSYSMPKPLASQALATPEWIERPPEPRGTQGFVVELDPQERRASQVARERRATVATAHGDSRTVEVGPLEPGDGAEVVREMVAAALRAVLQPLRIGQLALLALTVAMLASLVHGYDTGGAPADQVARAGLDQALSQERTVIEELIAIGGDRSTLDRLYANWHDAREPARTEAALRLVDEVDRISETLSQPGSTTWEDAHKRVRRLRVARDGYRQTLLEAASR